MSQKKRISSQINTIQEKINDIKQHETTPQNENKIVNLENLKEELQKTARKLKTKSNILWPSSTMNSEHRSRNKVLEIVRKLENGENLSVDETKGIKGRSLLLDLEDFNYIYDVPAEYLHSGCLGVVKRLVEMTFSVGVNRPRITKRKLSSTKTFNTLMSKVKVFKEFPRRARNLDFAVFKGQEFRNVCIFYFPIVIQCIEANAKERHLWLYLAYVVRACVIPTEEFIPLNINDIEDACEKYYKLYEKLFGPQNCTFNTHVFFSHLLEIRTHGPLPETSAFKFESFYGEIRRSFVPGTPSPMKQILSKILMKRTLQKHVCKNSMFLSNYETPLECNNLIYLYVQKQYLVYEISEIENNVLSCYQVGQYPVTFEETPEINWSTIGVFKKGPKSDEITKINVKQVCGKVINVNGFLITCPENVLNEK